MKVECFIPLNRIRCTMHILINYSSILNYAKNLFSELILSIPQKGTEIKNKKNFNFKNTSFNRNKQVLKYNLHHIFLLTA